MAAHRMCRDSQQPRVLGSASVSDLSDDLASHQAPAEPPYFNNFRAMGSYLWPSLGDVGPSLTACLGPVAPASFPATSAGHSVPCPSPFCGLVPYLATATYSQVTPWTLSRPLSPSFLKSPL